MFLSDITALLFSRITALFGIGISATTIPPLQKNFIFFKSENNKHTFEGLNDITFFRKINRQKLEKRKFIEVAQNIDKNYANVTKVFRNEFCSYLMIIVEICKYVFNCDEK